jgi:molecular chaperone GrpE
VSSSVRNGNDSDGPVIRDKRRIDPATGLPRASTGTGPAAGTSAAAGASADPGPPPAPEPEDAPGPVKATSASPADSSDGSFLDAAGGAETVPDELAALHQQLAERTADLQRLQAEYVNYRRRVDRDRESVREAAQTQVLIELLPVLDDIGRAREHGELDGAFASIAGALEATVTKLGLERYAAVGDPFDPTLHEALMHSYSDEVTMPTCVQVFAPGYRVGQRVVRPARVAVAEPGDATG